MFRNEKGSSFVGEVIDDLTELDNDGRGGSGGGGGGNCRESDGGGGGRAIVLIRGTGG